MLLNYYIFLTVEIICGIETRLFEGEDGKGKMPKYSLNDLDNGLFVITEFKS